MMDLLERAKILLKATKDLLEKQDNSCYVLNILNQTVFYDGVDCDGSCLKDDIDYWFDELEDTPPAKTIPLDKVEQARKEIQRYEVDCLLLEDSQICQECNNNMFKSIYNILDKLTSESEIRNG